MGFIDCDSHVFECAETWDYMDPAERLYSPTKVVVESKHHVEGVGNPFTTLWLVNESWTGDSSGNPRGVGNHYDQDAITLRDPSKRIADLDALNIDVQILNSSLFITMGIENPLAEAAVKRSWNRWLADRTADTKGRLRWTAEVPVRMLDRAIEEVEFAKAHGAVAVKMNGVENRCYLDDHYFDPLFARLEDLGLTVIVHLGRPNSQSSAIIPIGAGFRTWSPYVEQLASPMTGFWTVLTTDLHDRFPRLRFCISEASATWSLSLIHQYRRLMASTGSFTKPPWDPRILEEKNLFVTCEPDEDFGSLVSWLGEGVLCAGTDYAHNDLSAALNAHNEILARTDITQSAAKKIVDENGRRAFDLDPDFRPTDGRSDRQMPATLPFTYANDPGSADVAGVIGGMRESDVARSSA